MPSPVLERPAVLWQPGRPRERRTPWLTAVVVSLAAHLALLGWLAAANDSGLGGSTTPLEAISVEIVTLPAVPASGALAQQQGEPAPDSDANPESPRPDSNDAPPTQTADAKPEQPEPPPEPAQIVKPDPPLPMPPPEAETALARAEPAPQPDEQPPPEAKPREIRPPEPPEPEPEPEREPRPEPAATRPSPAPASSSASASTTSLAIEQPARTATASPGEVRAFARAVAQALARTPPQRLPRTGTVVVSFTVSPRGDIERAVVTRSSGEDRLDDAALAAVRRARLPRPPSAANASQRTFEVPYQFRRRE